MVLSADKRKVSTDALETLGQIIDETQKRDAIHLAVEPIEALERLYPGQDVGVVAGKATAATAQCVGIVDPFLKRPVQPGERFWLVVYPRQIHSLRHVWTHPAFADEPAHTSRAKEASERWLRDFVDQADCSAMYEEVMAAAARADNNDYLLVYGDASGAIPPEFWDHVEVVTGQRCPFRPTFFSCTC